jgi:hypothetical protein
MVAIYELGAPFYRYNGRSKEYHIHMRFICDYAAKNVQKLV